LPSPGFFYGDAQVPDSEVLAMAERLLPLRDVIPMVGIKRSSILTRINEGTFPRPVRIARRLSLWPESEVQAWVKMQIEAGDEALSAGGAQ
jgi:prophage regulatory protein